MHAYPRDTSYTTKPVLEVDRKSRTRAFVRVDVSGVGRRRVVSARLQLRVASQPGAASDSGGRVSWSENCAWNEDMVRWKDQPNRTGKELRTLRGVAAGELLEIDATSVVCRRRWHSLLHDREGVHERGALRVARDPRAAPALPREVAS